MDENEYPIVNVSHIDLDGYGCTLFLKSMSDCGWDFYNVDYKEVEGLLKTLPKNIHLILTDLSFGEEMRGLLESFRAVSIFDHHETTKWVLDRPLKNAVDVVVSMEHCGSYLVYEHYKKRFKMDSNHFESYVKLIDDYDMWVHKYPDSDRLNSLLYISNREIFIKNALMMSASELLSKNKARIDSYLKQREDYVNSTEIHMVQTEPVRIAVAFAEKYKSHIADKCFKNDVADLVYVVDLHTNVISIRSSANSGIDCSDIATKYLGGGGHIHASGGYISEDMIEFDDAFIYLKQLPIGDKVKTE